MGGETSQRSLARPTTCPRGHAAFALHCYSEVNEATKDPQQSEAEAESEAAVGGHARIEATADADAQAEATADGDARAEAVAGGDAQADAAASGDAQAEAHPRYELTEERRARRDHALSFVRKFGDPVLRATARPVEHFDDDLRKEVERMGVIMDDGLGIGLAATQVGVLHRLLVYRIDDASELVALVNPKLEWHSREQEGAEEGCLSLPRVSVEVDRPIHVRVSALDEYGEPIEIEAAGMEARVIQHEMDHLDGVLILDRTSREQRKQAMRELREWQSAEVD